MSWARLSACMYIAHKGHNNTMQGYSVTVMIHVKALEAGQSSQGTSEPTCIHRFVMHYVSVVINHERYMLNFVIAG